MALDVRNNQGTHIGSAINGRVTVKGNRNNNQLRDASQGNDEYLIDLFGENYLDDFNPKAGHSTNEINPYPRWFTGDKGDEEV